MIIFSNVTFGKKSHHQGALANSRSSHHQDLHLGQGGFLSPHLSYGSDPTAGAHCLGLTLTLHQDSVSPLAITKAWVPVVVFVWLILFLQLSEIVAACLDGGELLLLPQAVDVLVHHPLVLPQPRREHVRLGQPETVEADPDGGDVVQGHQALARQVSVADCVELPGQ